MGAATPLPREEARECERKYVVSAPDAARFLARIEDRTALELTDRSKTVCYNRTTYLDTPDRAYYRSSLSGIARKLRIREYATASREGAPPAFSGEIFLELKESGGGFRSKTRVPLAALDAIGPETLAAHPSLSMFDALLREHEPVPMLTTFYRRIRRTCLEAPVRITVDSGVRFSPPVRPGTVLICGSPLFHLRQSIIEIKSAAAIPGWLLDELDGATEDASFSKFEHGMRLVGGLP